MVIQYIVTGIITVILIQLIVRLSKIEHNSLNFLPGNVLGNTLVFIWLPTNTIDKLGKLFGVGRGIDVLVYLSIVFIFYYIFKQNEKVNKLEKQITKLVRELAKQNARS